MIALLKSLFTKGLHFSWSWKFGNATKHKGQNLRPNAEAGKGAGPAGKKTVERR